MNTTLNKIRDKSPCKDVWEKLLTHLGKTEADDESLAITTIIDSNGLDDAIWCLRTVEGHDREIRLYAVWCARQVQHLMTDQRSIDALDVAERFANGQATEQELSAAEAAAWDAARAARQAAADAAWDAARAAVGDAVRDAARDAAWAAWAAAWDAAEAALAARAAAWAAARDAQEMELRRVCEGVAA